MENNQKSILNTVYIGIFAALITVGSYISIPLPLSPVPVSLQSLFVLLTGILLGPWRAALALVLYLMLGAIGLPVFAGGTGGLARILGPTGGYLVGFLLAAWLSGFIFRLLSVRPMSEKTETRVTAAIQSLVAALAALSGTIMIYLPGLLWLKLQLSMEWSEVFTAGLTPFIVGDLAKILVTALVAPFALRLFADSGPQGIRDL